MHYHYRYKGGGIVFFLPPPLQPAVARCLLWLDGCCQSVTEQALLVKLSNLFWADCDDSITCEVRGEHDALGLCLREIVD